MSNHVTEWLNAYFDGELTGRRLEQVEEHLAECEACQTELDSLQDVSKLLRDAPAPELVSLERFAAEVNLRLPRRQAVISTNRIFEVSWWMIPAGLLAAWVFIGTAFIVSDLVSAAGRLGLLSDLSGWLASAPSNEVYWSTAIGQMGLLSGNGLNWAEATEAFSRMFLPQFALEISIALLYLGWIAIWWARHARQESGRLLEG